MMSIDRRLREEMAQLPRQLDATARGLACLPAGATIPVMGHGDAHPEFTVLGLRGEVLRCAHVPRGLTAQQAVQVIVGQHQPELLAGPVPVYLMARADDFGGWSLPGQDEPFDALGPLTADLRLRQDRDPAGVGHLGSVDIATLLDTARADGMGGSVAYRSLEQALVSASGKLDQRRRDRMSLLGEQDAVALAASCACLTVSIDDPGHLQARCATVARHWQRVRLESWRVVLRGRQERLGDIIVELRVFPERLEGSPVLVKPTHR